MDKLMKKKAIIGIIVAIVVAIVGIGVGIGIVMDKKPVIVKINEDGAVVTSPGNANTLKKNLKVGDAVSLELCYDNSNEVKRDIQLSIDSATLTRKEDESSSMTKDVVDISYSYELIKQPAHSTYAAVFKPYNFIVSDQNGNILKECLNSDGKTLTHSQGSTVGKNITTDMFFHGDGYNKITAINVAVIGDSSNIIASWTINV